MIIQKFEPLAKSVEEKPHTALGACPLSRIANEHLSIDVTRVAFDGYYPTSRPFAIAPTNTLHGLIKAIQGVMQSKYNTRTHWHAITDYCIETIEVTDKGVAKVYLGS